MPGHETYSLVKNEVAAEEQTLFKVKGFGEPIRAYKVLGLYDNLAEEGLVIREEQDGSDSGSIGKVEEFLTRLKK
jgi:hypothetical protein